MLYELVMGRHEEVLNRCRVKLRAMFPQRAEEELLGELATLLDETVRALGSVSGRASSSPLPGRSEAAARHGERRFESGDDVVALVQEAGVLCEAITETAIQQGVTMQAVEAQELNRCVDAVACEAIRHYTAHSEARRASRVNEELGALVHELRNALSSAILGYQLIREGRVAPRGRTADMVQRNLDRMAALIADAVSTVQERAASDVKIRGLQLPELLRNVVEASPADRGITVTLECEEGAEVFGDEQALVSAVGNLVQNAIKFTRDGGRVVVRARMERGWGVIEVEDECGGLPTGRAEELFAPFVQRGSDRSGLGLGLGIAQRAIRAHRGEMTVTSLPGRGCVFRVRLPVDASWESSAPPPAPGPRDGASGST